MRVTPDYAHGIRFYPPLFTPCVKGKRVMEQNLSRRHFLGNSVALGTGLSLMENLSAWGAANAIPQETTDTMTSTDTAILPLSLRVAVIGHTWRGDYGHDLHLAWRDVPRDARYAKVEVVALADPDEAGRTKAIADLGEAAQRAKAFADWRQMLEEVKPDILTICPRFIDVHCEMLLAAADSGVQGVFCEKPLCRTLAEADRVIAACDRTGMQVVMAHQTRYSPIWQQVKSLIAANKIGNVLEIRARGKEDARSGVEDTIVLGTHLFDMVQDIWGMPQWCFGTVATSDTAEAMAGTSAIHPITRADLHEAGDGIGQIAGDTLHAMYGLTDGKMLYFDSANDGRGGARFGLRIYGSQGIIEVGMGYMPPAYLFPHRTWSPIRGKKEWMPISSAGLNKEEPIPEAERALHWGNVAACKDLLSVLGDTTKHPIADIRQARTAMEMIYAPVISQIVQGGPVTMPLVERGDPFARLP